MMAGALCACGHRASQTEGTTGADSTVTDSATIAVENLIEVETVSFEKNDSTAEVSLLIQWPTKGEKAIVDSLQQFIGELVGSKIGSPQAIEAYGESLFKILSDEWHGVYDEMEPDDRLGAFSKTHDVTFPDQTDRYITLFYHTFDYGGGAHGYTTEVGFTFRKSDGKQLGEQIPMLTDTDSPKFAQILKEGVRSFFSDGTEPMSDEELLEYLFAEEVESLDNLPLPGNHPYFTKTGVVFLYTQYEIGPYSSGIIRFEVPFNDILPYLTPEAQAMIE